MTTPALSSRRATAIGATFLAVLPLSTDIILVALPVIAGSFDAPLSGGHQIMSAFVIGLAAAHVLVGALADRFGRRSVALAGYAFYALASVGAMAATSLEMLLAFRFLQGLSGACGPILMRAMVRDLSASGEAAKRLAAIGTVSGIAPLLAPTLGVLIANAFGWQSSFAVLALYGATTFLLVLFLMPETLAREDRRFSLITPALAAELLRDRSFLLGSITMACGYGGLFTWLSTGSYWLTGDGGLDPLLISFIFTLGSLCFMLGGLYAMRGNATSHRLIAIGASLGLVGGALSLLLSVFQLGAAWASAPIMLFYVGWGIAQPQAINIAMRNHALVAGRASALLGLIQLGGGAALSWIVVQAGAGPAIPAMLVATSATILIANGALGKHR